MPRKSKLQVVKKTRESRSAYRVKKSKPRTPKRRTLQSAIVPSIKRIAPTTEQLLDWNAWLSEHEAEFERKFPGHYMAIWDKQILAATPDGDAIYRLAHRAMPTVIPLVTFIPHVEDLPIVLTPFPSSFS